MTKSSLEQIQADIRSRLNTKQLDPKELLRLELLSSLEKYTKAMFKAQYRRSFVMNEHFHKIFEALESVVDGKCTRLIINMPPRYGKCCYYLTPVLTDKGSVLIKDIKPGDKVWSFDNGKAVLQKVSGVEPAYKPSVCITMHSGRSIIISEDHPMLSTFGYKQAKDFKAGDSIIALNAPIDGPIEINDNELIFVSNMIFEGACKRPTYTYANTDDDLIYELALSCKALNIEIRHLECQKSFEYLIEGPAAKDILQKYNIHGHLAYDKRLPSNWSMLSLRQKYMFIGIMFATDGCITKTGQGDITLANEGLISDIQDLLMTTGIISIKAYKPTAGKGAWRLTIPRKYMRSLKDKVYFYGKTQKFLDYVMNKEDSCITDTLPFEIIKHEKLYYQLRLAGMRCEPNKNITRDKFKRISKVFTSLQKYLFDNFYYDKVISVKTMGPQQLVHLSVENTHNFIADGLVSHNTETVIKAFSSWCFALNPMCKFLHLSYSDLLVTDNSTTIRNIMMEPLYKQLFPNSALEKEKGSSTRWKTVAGGEFYAVSTQGQVTGFGAGLVDEEDESKMSYEDLTFDRQLDELLGLIGAKANIFNGAILIDDPMKPEDAESDIVRDRINARFDNTIRSRVNSRNTPIIIIMQRLHEDDLCGHLLQNEPDDWTVLSLPAIQVDPDTLEEKPLWEMKHTLKELYDLRKKNPLVFDTQYMQDPKPKEGLMYQEGFKTYKPEQLPIGKDAMKRWNYTDTADTGADFLCSICFIDTPEVVYVTDVLFTKDPMEITEPATARMLNHNRTIRARIESNNGGRGFMRAVKSILRVTMRNFICAVEAFTQTENKFSRIFTYSANVMSDIYMPEGWEHKWPEFYNALTSYRKDTRRRSQHDDAPDAITGVYEMHMGRNNRRGVRQRN